MWPVEFYRASMYDVNMESTRQRYMSKYMYMYNKTDTYLYQQTCHTLHASFSDQSKCDQEQFVDENARTPFPSAFENVVSDSADAQLG